MALIELNHIKKDYDLGHTKVPALRDIDISLERGEFVAIVGQSRSGKSTLMNIIGNLDSRTGEEIVGLFLDLHKRGNTIILVTHEPKLAARCPRAVRLVDGLVIADGPGKQVAMANAEALGEDALAQFLAAQKSVEARP